MLIKLAWRNLWRNKLRTSIMSGAMVFGLMGVVAMMGFSNGMTDSMINNAISWQTSHAQIHNRAFNINPDINDFIHSPQLIEQHLDNNKDVQRWVSRFLVDGMIASARSTRGVRINGIDHEKERAFTPIAEHLVEGSWLDSTGRNPILVSSKTAQRLKLRIGSKVVITFTNPQGEVTGAAFRVRGIFKTPSTAYDDGNVLVRKKDIQALSQLEQVHEYAIFTQDASGAASEVFVRQLVAQLTNQLDDDIDVRGWYQIQPLLATMISTMQTSNQIMLTVFVIAMAFGIVNIMLMSVFERTQEFGVLMAVGMQKHKIFGLILLETLMLGVLGALLGILGSMLMIKIMQITGLPLGSMAEGLGAYGVDTVLYPKVTNGEYVMVLMTVFTASLFAALYPARQILKQRPVDALADKH